MNRIHRFSCRRQETYDDRFQNLQELKTNIARYLEENEDGDLQGFLEEVSLLSDIDAYNEQADVVVLMTLHSAKGLEFPVVFLVGMEEGIFRDANRCTTNPKFRRNEGLPTWE